MRASSAYMKLSRAVTYGLQASLKLAEDQRDEPIPATRLAVSCGLPDRFLLQILRSLVKHGILRSSRGVVGGYRLARKVDDVSVLDLIEAIEGPITAVMPTQIRTSAYAQGLLRAVLEEATSATRKELQAIRLSNLLSRPAETTGLPPTLEPTGAITNNAEGIPK
jgi:Rrf2 family protein